jgi:hypothetical protein
VKSPVRWVIAGRLLLLLLSIGAVFAAFFLVQRQHEQSEVGVSYVCPMHPEVVAIAPGQCPICRMALERAHRSAQDGFHRTERDRFSLTADVPTPHHSETGELARLHVFTEELRAPAWFESQTAVAAILYNDEATWPELADQATFSLGAEASPSVALRLAHEPPAPWDGTTVVVHFRVEPAESPFPTGAVGWVRSPARPHAALVIPDAAVLHTEEGSYVLTPSAEHRVFTRKLLELGKVVNGLVRVVSGLRDQERITTGDVFFLDAEQRLRTQAETQASLQP